MSLIYRTIGLAIGIALYLYSKGKSERIKFQWLSHFLLGSGRAKMIPNEIAKHWDSNWVQRVEGNKYFIRPYGTSLFWLVGGMTVQREGNKVYGTDVYDFHMQNGQNVIHGTDKTQCWAFSGGEKDETHIPERLTHIGFTLASFIGLSNEFKVEGERLLVSNNLWNKLGGKPFESVLDVEV